MQRSFAMACVSGLVDVASFQHHEEIDGNTSGHEKEDRIQVLVRGGRQRY